MDIAAVLRDLGIEDSAFAGDHKVISPITGQVIGRVATSTPAEVDNALEKARAAQSIWRDVPAPRRGELVRRRATNTVNYSSSLPLAQGIDFALG